MSRLSRFLPFIILAIPLFLFLPGINAFPFPPGSPFSDLAITHYPNAVYLRYSLQQWGEIPLWSNTILSGYPFAANPLSGLWYPPAWLTVVFPIPLGFNLLVLVHLYLGAVGVYLLLRAERIAELPALFGGLLFELMPKLIGHYALGHVTLVWAVCWTPWLLLSTLRTLGNKRTSLFPGVIFGFLILADIRWSVYAGLLWFCYRMSLMVPIHLKPRNTPVIEILRRFFLPFFFQAAIGLAISAPLWVPLMEYSSFSTRSSLSSQDLLGISIGPKQFLNLLIPDVHGYAETITYFSAAAFLLFLWMLGNKKIREKNRFWIGVVFIGAIISLGSNIPWASEISRIPGLDLLRVPARAMFLVGIGLAMAGSKTLDCLIAEGKDKNYYGRLAIVGLPAFLLIITVFLWIVSGEIPSEFAWGAIASSVVSVWIFTLDFQRSHTRTFLIIGIGLLLLDIGLFDVLNIEYRPSSAVLAEGNAIAQDLGQEKGLFRVYSPSYSIPQQSAANLHLELADGVDPLQITSYAKFMESATGVIPNGYSVTIPGFSTGDPTRDNKNASLSPKLLGLLNVRYIVSAFAVTNPELKLINSDQSTWIYENSYWLPRAWIQPKENSIGDGWQPVNKIDWQPNSIGIDVNGPGLLTLSEIIYPGWTVFVDGTQSSIIPVDAILRGVELTAGNHQVEFIFKPMSVYIGLCIALIAWVVGLGYLLKRRSLP